MKRVFVTTVALAAIGLSGLAHVRAAVPASQALYDEIQRMDTALSDAFNAHDMSKLKALFAEDLEFYQDNDGLARYEQTMKDFASMFAQGNKMRRKLVAGSLEVYPIKDYGAIQIGSHQFCHLENGKDECGTFRFVHVWRRDDGAWKISRVVSYAHQESRASSLREIAPDGHCLTAVRTASSSSFGTSPTRTMA